MKILKKGAEADVYLSSWDGKKSVLKIRKEKKYRNPRLDERIRKQRRIEEQKRRKENFLNESIKQVKRKRLVESSFSSYEQERTTKRFLRENRNFNFIGKNNLPVNLIFTKCDKIKKILIILK